MADTTILEPLELPKVVDVPDQPCQRLYEGNPVLLGYDVVQYHFINSYRDGGVAVRGIPKYAYNYEGYQFWFATNENRERFIKEPMKYAPAWGGFCSYGMALERKPKWPWEIDFLGPPASPWEGWLIVDGTLIFNIWADYSDRFMEDSENNMIKASQRWKNWFKPPKRQPFNTHCIGHGPLKNWCLSQQPSPWMDELPECQLLNSESINSTESDTSNLQIECTQIAISGGIMPTSCDDVLVLGGGVVSSSDEFSHFPNSKYSPYQRNVFISLVSLSIFVVLTALAVIYRRRSLKLESEDTETISKSENVANGVVS